MSNLSVKAADIGIAQLAMHSSYETSGAYDTIYMSEFVKEFYGKEIIKWKQFIIIAYWILLFKL